MNSAVSERPADTVKASVVEDEQPSFFRLDHSTFYLTRCLKDNVLCFFVQIGLTGVYTQQLLNFIARIRLHTIIFIGVK